MASRRQMSLMCSWTPKISWTTSTTGKGPPVGRHRAVGRHLAVGHGDLHLAGVESLGVGRDRGLGRDRLHRQGEAGGQRGDDELASREVDTGSHARRSSFIVGT